MKAILSKMHNKAIVRISKATFVPHSAFETAHRWRYANQTTDKGEKWWTIAFSKNKKYEIRKYGKYGTVMILYFS